MMQPKFPTSPISRARRSVRRLGLTLVETIIVMIIASAALAAGAGMYADHLNNVTNRAAAQELKRVSDAFSQYLDDAHHTLLTQVVNNGGIMNVPISDLQPDYLPNEFQNRSPYNHRYVLTVRKPSATSNNLEGLVHTEYASSEFALDSGDAQEIARMVGTSGGYTDPIDPQSVVSTYSNYSLDLSDFGVNPGAGALVSSLAVESSGDGGSKFLHRAAMADPALNRMDTNLNMGGHNVNNAGVVAATGVNTNTLTANSATVSGNLQTGTATVTGAATVGGNIRAASATVTGNLTSASATVSGHLQANTSRTVGRAQANSLVIDGAPTTPGAGDIAASSVHTSNWFRSHGASGWYSQTYGGGWHMQDSTWIRAYGGKSVYTPGTMQAGQLTSTGHASVAGTTTSGHVTTSNATVHGAINVGGRVTANDMYATGWVSLGGACTAGQIARAGTSTVTCVNGKWASGGGGIGTLAGIYILKSGSGLDQGTRNHLTGGYSCPAGSRAFFVNNIGGAYDSQPMYFCIIGY